MQRFSSIAVQSLLAVLLTVISVLTLSSIVELKILERREISMLEERGRLTTARIANSLSSTLWNLNQEETERVVRDEIKSVDISLIQVFDEKNTPYLGAFKDADGAIKVTHAGDADGVATNVAASAFSFSRDIIHGEKIGSVTLGVTDAHLQSALSKLKWGIAIKLLLLVIILSVVLLIALRVLVVSPLSRLESWVERIPAEKEVTPPRFRHSAEITSLAQAFTRMSLKLKQKNEALQDEESNLRQVNEQLRIETEERSRAEEAAKTSEQKFSKVFRLSPVPLAATRLSDGKVVEVNEAMERFTGYPRDEMIGRTTLDFGLWLRSEDRQQVFADLGKFGSIQNREVQVVNKSGKVLAGHYSAEVIEIDGEQCMLSGILDMTERRQAEEALKTNEALLRLFIKHTPTAIAMFDTEMRYLQVSDRFLSEYHLEDQNIIGKSHYEVFPHLPQRWKQVHQRILKGAVERSAEDSYLTPDGRIEWLQWESLPWRRANGEIGGLILFTQVITERKQAEQALRASEERFVKIFNLSPYRMGIIRINDGVILEVNDAWIEDTGFSRAEVINKPYNDFLAQFAPELVKQVSRVIKSNKPRIELEGSFQTKDGDQRVTHTTAVRFDLDDEPCYLWASNDITERTRAEQALRALSARIQSAREEEGTRIAREIHDELGSALTGLKWDLERIDKSLTKSGNGSGVLDIRKRIGTMTSLVEATINTVRRISSDLRPGVLDDLGLVAALEWQLQQFQSRSGLKCHWKSQVEDVEVNRERATAVFRIFQEILTNVLRHADATSLYVTLVTADKNFELEVMDDGRGITESERMNTGSLGLLGMKERALLVGGEVEIRGIKGTGTTVTVRVPLG